MKGSNQLSTQEQKTRFEQMVSNCDENKYCADCCAKNPSWGSLGFGVLLCLNCAGAHRSLGYHITRVRSFKLDGWDQNQVEILENTGNKISNDYWEYKLSKQRRPTTNASQNELQNFVDEKYIKKMFAPGKEYLDPVKEYQQNQLQNKIKSILKLETKQESPIVYHNFYTQENEKVQPSVAASPPTKPLENPVTMMQQANRTPNVNLLDFEDKEMQPKYQSGDLLEMTIKEPSKVKVQQIKQAPQSQQQQPIQHYYYNQQQQINDQFFAAQQYQQTYQNQQYQNYQNNFFGLNQRNYNCCQRTEGIPQQINQMNEQKGNQPVDIVGMYD